MFLSVLRYRLPRFRGKGQNQRHKSIEIIRLNYKLVSMKQEQDLIIWQKSSLQMLGFGSNIFIRKEWTWNTYIITYHNERIERKHYAYKVHFPKGVFLQNAV